MKSVLVFEPYKEVDEGSKGKVIFERPTFIIERPKLDMISDEKSDIQQVSFEMFERLFEKNQNLQRLCIQNGYILAEWVIKIRMIL